ncbi:unnamed protein product [Phytomonas sp. Hart1]|nr:unnamed protein product [Phytomonas sp. Hart1]|eukprot:CCW69758.1 unnamed protein product [Phytomonas sp. isolate Hart1]
MDEHNCHSKILDSTVSSTTNLFASLHSQTLPSNLHALSGKNSSTAREVQSSKSLNTRRQFTTLDSSSTRRQVVSTLLQTNKDTSIHTVSARNVTRSTRTPFMGTKPKSLVDNSASHRSSCPRELLSREASKPNFEELNEQISTPK